MKKCILSLCDGIKIHIFKSEAKQKTSWQNFASGSPVCKTCLRLTKIPSCILPGFPDSGVLVPLFPLPHALHSRKLAFHEAIHLSELYPSSPGASFRPSVQANQHQPSVPVATRTLFCVIDPPGEIMKFIGPFSEECC